MIFYVLGITLYLLIGLFLILIILLQKGRGSAGLGAFREGSQILFGGSGGQELFQKITWTLGALFMALSLSLAIVKTNAHRNISYKGSEVPIAPHNGNGSQPVSSPDVPKAPKSAE